MVNGPRRVVVTGGAGFIGSHLVERLLNDGHEVIVLDNFSTGRAENLRRIERYPRLTVKQTDVSSHSEISSFFTDISWVFHLAAFADIVPSIQRPLEYHRANVDGTVAVLEAARLAGVERFIYAASSSCYGIPDELPTPETSPIRPMHPYALTKYLGEQYVLHWNKVYKLPCISLRLFNVYGPRQRTSGAYGAVFGIFLAQKLAGKPFTVVGDGTLTRDFTFVSDVVEAFVRAAESEIVGEVFNVGSGGTYSINRLVSLLDGDAVYIPKRPGEPDSTFADITKISHRLGWRPKVCFDDGVRIMLENIEEWRSAPVWDDRSIAQATKEWFAYLGDSSIKWANT
jgi:UDP-glucose 4-epimerase